MYPKITEKVIANVRSLIADIVEQADSGHPGSALALTPLLLELYSILHYDPTNSKHPLRDAFILSNAHACPVLYAVNFLTGYLSLQDLKEFRQLHSKTPGHPERNHYIELTSEPLGQGVAQSVGLAIAFKRQGLGRKVVCVFGDGCYQEGITQEAFSIANHLNLTNLTYIYDYNAMTIDGETTLTMTEDVFKRFAHFPNFKVYDYNKINLKEVLEEECVKMIIHKSVIGKGCALEGMNRTHGLPLGKDVIKEMKEKNSLENEPFFVSEELNKYSQELKKYKIKEIDEITKEKVEFIKSSASFLENNESEETIFNENWENYKFSNGFKEPSIVRTFDKFLKDFYTKLSDLPRENKTVATRKHLQSVVKMIPYIPQMIYGSADLAQSLLIKHNQKDLQSDMEGNFINFGVREHAMCAIFNGLSAFGYICLGGTFLNFVHYCFTGIRSASLDNLKVIYIFTHDSILVGEDGPTHQGVEALALLRATPNLHVLRPCDEVEVRYSVWYALQRNGPTALIFTRQPVAPVLQTDFLQCKYGAYFLKKEENYDLTIFTTGSEVPLSLKVAEYLKNKYIVNVVSVLSFEIFNEQSKEYKRNILGNKPRVSIEIGTTFGWSMFGELCIGMDSFGKSGPHEELLEYYGFTDEKIGEKIIQWMMDK
ncbi:hypothetical protein H312_01747 [Anncaliia algerae PRA339]|uniref:Transketolase-like pyrimidine-binding domain-containing protein n=1 Tax=Anncaliia algerae PRA339 TaxID=1288291 RepID=A0A059F1H9_9MICR|nr:hypothetical protein H312_01747 [Anncaliia algerae PRA339]